MNQCLRALNYLNSKGVCHRDIKLENIMIFDNHSLQNIKLIDFGLSRQINFQVGKININDEGKCSGTPYYVAPEVISRKITTASDLWSIGVVMYQCLTGHLPF